MNELNRLKRGEYTTMRDRRQLERLEEPVQCNCLGTMCEQILSQVYFLLAFVNLESK